MTWTEDEKLALCAAIGSVVMVDGVENPGETEYLIQLSDVAGLHPHHYQRSAKMNLVTAVGTLRSMSNEKKMLLVQILLEMGKADGHLSRDEKNLLYAIFESAGIRLTKPL